jgi:hypothetical protein
VNKGLQRGLFLGDLNAFLPASNATTPQRAANPFMRPIRLRRVRFHQFGLFSQLLRCKAEDLIGIEFRPHKFKKEYTVKIRAINLEVIVAFLENRKVNSRKKKLKCCSIG